ncbi:MAG: FeoA domain-containing protein [Saprospiraceae bacterium]
MKTLNDLRPGEEAFIQEIDLNIFACKFLSFGLMPRTKVHMVRLSPLGDAYYIKLGALHLAIRKSEASSIKIVDV